MIFREAQPDDISQIMIVRFAVKENRLSDPALVTAADCEEYLFNRGKGWVCLENEVVVGFSIIDLKEKNVWALFVHPDFAEKGIGKTLHGMMLEWYFDQSNENIWLDTSPATRAEQFYRMQGWQATGVHGKGEIKFEMSFERFKNKIVAVQKRSFDFLYKWPVGIRRGGQPAAVDVLTNRKKGNENFIFKKLLKKLSFINRT